MKISKNYLQKPNRDPHLHSPGHVLADELSSKLGDQRHFGFYLKTALTIDHNVLRQIAGQVLEGKSKNPGALFAYLVKKYNREKTFSTGYSIWLLPEESAANRFREIISSLAGAYKTLAFEPHITIISDMPEAGPEKLDDLKDIKEIDVELQSIETEEVYFKSFYLPVVRNKPLDAIRRRARKIFSHKSAGKFQPHLSLIYGNFPPERKLEMIRNFTALYPKLIKLSSIALVNTNGPVTEWQINKKISLSQIA